MARTLNCARIARQINMECLDVWSLFPFTAQSILKCFKTGVAVEACASVDAKREKERLRKDRQRQRKLADTLSWLEAALHASNELIRYIVIECGRIRFLILCARMANNKYMQHSAIFLNRMTYGTLLGVVSRGTNNVYVRI